MPAASSTSTQMGGNSSGSVLQPAVRVQVLPGLSSYHQIQTGTQRQKRTGPDGQTQRSSGCKSRVFVPLSKKPVDSDLITLQEDHMEAFSDLQINSL